MLQRMSRERAAEKQIHPRHGLPCSKRERYACRMTQIRCSALLFDMDGVLIDSTPAVARVWCKWAIAHNFEPDEVVARAHGRPSIVTVREYLPESDDVAEYRLVEQAEMEDLEGVAPLPGARELLKSLPADRWTIVTSSTRTPFSCKTTLSTSASST